MNTKQLTTRYASWLLLLVISIATLFIELNRNSYFSIPIEVFVIALALILVAAAYLLKLKNKYFLALLWLMTLASTIAVVWFILLLIAYPFGTEATIILYIIAGLFIGWKYLRKN